MVCVVCCVVRCVVRCVCVCVCVVRRALCCEVCAVRCVLCGCVCRVVRSVLCVLYVVYVRCCVLCVVCVACCALRVPRHPRIIELRLPTRGFNHGPCIFMVAGVQNWAVMRQNWGLTGRYGCETVSAQPGHPGTTPGCSWSCVSDRVARCLSPVPVARARLGSCDSGRLAVLWLWFLLWGFHAGCDSGCPHRVWCV